MVRKRLPYRFIEDERRRKSTFGKRLDGIKKKAMELSTLCGIDVVLICTGSADNNSIQTWPENLLEVQNIIDRFGRLGIEDRDRRKGDLKSHMKNQIKKISAELNRLRRDNVVNGYLMFNYGILLPQGISNTSAVFASLEAKLAAVNERIGVLMDNMKLGNNVDSFCLDDSPITFSHYFEDQVGMTGLDEMFNNNCEVGGNGQSSQFVQDVMPLNYIMPQLQQVDHYNNGEGCSTTSTFVDPYCVNYAAQDSEIGFSNSNIARMISNSTTPALPPPPYDNQIISKYNLIGDDYINSDYLPLMWLTMPETTTSSNQIIFHRPQDSPFYPGTPHQM
ncbi:hypothetical protein ZOSMA_1G02510 [Zostera marina]|uniref:MADS-box domain-containing protein n=1 Tax=Zostera marina TaxID=29655 RepID=A0A0K9PMU4_ZOSMR|nr:hypothetical protein ZOSMA_1G02510 [Zostera marina]